MIEDEHFTRYGLFEYTRMPFGLWTSRGMELVLQGLQLEMMLIFLDDVINASSDFQIRITHLTQVFDSFREHGHHLKPANFLSEASYLSRTLRFCTGHRSKC
jgi:hypothetical protein